MPIKMTGAEFKRFYTDPKYWPEGGQTYHDDQVVRVNGTEKDSGFDLGAVADTDIIEIEGGIVLHSPFYKEGKEPSLEAYIKRWRKDQSTACFAVECDRSLLETIQASIRAAGGKIIG